jgi:aryl-alcohol dehydrogenase-like predicted oxidoreductase
LFTRDPEAEVLPTLRELGIALVCYAPLGRGFLSGRFRFENFPPDDFRRQLPRYQGANFDHNLRLLDRIDTIAHRRGITSSQLALAWLMSQGDDVVPIPGMETVDRLEENVAAVDVKLSPANLESLDSVMADWAAGARYGDPDKFTNAESAERT